MSRDWKGALERVKRQAVVEFAEGRVVGTLAFEFVVGMRRG